MPIDRCNSAALATFFMSLPLSSPAFAIDCTKAQDQIEKAICGDAGAKAADDAMGAAFRALLGRLSGTAKETLLDDQRAWIASRNRHCLSHRLPPTACAKTKAETRTAVLQGRPESGPGLAGRLQPTSLRYVPEAEKIEFEAQFFHFPAPQNAGERLLNEEADASTAQFEEELKNLKEYKDEAPEAARLSYHETWTLRYASPSFVSIWKEQDQYSGGAHPMGSANGLNIDLRSGRKVTFADLFETKALEPIARLCRTYIETHNGERLADIEPSAISPRITEGVADLTAWSFTETDIRIYFGTGTLGDAYASGTFECTLPVAALNRLAKAPLPPGR